MKNRKREKDEHDIVDGGYSRKPNYKYKIFGGRYRGISKMDIYKR